MSEGIVVVGSCMIDFTSYVPRLPKPGETLVGMEFKRTVGGKGANQCVSAAKLGASTTLIASLGSDIFGEEYLQILKSFKINTNFIKIRKDVSSGVAQIMVADNGENSIVIVLGANALLCPADVDEAEGVIKNAAVLLTQFETSLDTTLHALKLHKGRGVSIVNGAPAVANPDLNVLKNCDIFCVNETETEIMTGIEPLTLDNAQEALNKLFKLGCNTVIITLGAEGAVFASRDEPEMTHVPVEKVKPVDTTGAGDAFLGALAYFIAYHSKLTLKKQIERACQVAKKSVMKAGTQPSFPIKDELSKELFL
ncbi:ribokinase isoform X1 [Microplitis demolitor]|uniref:ribokinase isoform X1 n=1 Tax=Microplitis demolitor TaxID=69319 RepID=UPI0004CD4CD5|nr:ribokinase isoform X1 [Microplitis demolitor]XP_008551446.1 ribokinase isoform X1 [Microplitis demolitor]